MSVAFDTGVKMSFAKWQHYLRARLFHALRNEDAALAEYRLAAQAAPGFSRPLACIAFIHARRGEHAAAISHFREVLKLESQDAGMHFNLGFVCEKHGALQDAIAAFKAAVELDPKFDRAWYGMGICHAALGDHAAAAAALHEAATLQPMNPHAWYALGMAQHHLHQSDKVKEVILHLHRFDPRMTRHLIQDAGRSDLAYLVADLAV